MSTITVIGIVILLVYALTKILEFYDIGSNVYGSYLTFYIFILITSFVLPRDYVTLKTNPNN